jgi:hypothetical protein
MADRASWWLKVDRAEHHLNEIEDKLGKYAELHPYEHFRGPALKWKPHVWRYMLRITEQPNPMIAVIVGEFLYDLRSALDHIAVAMAPLGRRRSASFPIFLKDPFRQDRWGKYVDDKARASFESSTCGMASDALTILKEAQPYNGPTPDQAALYLLSSLENADKHRNLVTLTSGIQDAVTRVTARKTELFQSPPGLREDGAEIATFSWQKTWNPAELTEAEVNVQVRGVASVTIKVRDTNGHYPLPDSLGIMLEDVRSVIPHFEPYTRP